MVVIARTSLDELTSGFAGEIVRPGDATYDERRAIWNGSIDRRPAAIARCTNASDVAMALQFARQHGLEIAVRGGGHSFPGHSVCADGLVVDLSAMKAMNVDPDARTAKVEPGVLIGELDAVTQPYGLALPAGIVSHTGVAGLTLGGGLGWLMRRHGLTIDHLLSATMVTVDGETVRASESENADLFWGLRGGGGNFGVVTEFEFRLAAVGPTVLGGPIWWPIDQAPQVLRFYRDWVADAPDDLMTIVVHRKLPPLPAVPAELHGRLVSGVVCLYTGAVEEGQRVIQPLRDFSPPLLDLCAPKPFVEHQASFDPSYPHGWWYYVRSCDVAELSDDVIDITVEHARRIRSPRTAFPIWQGGGAVARVGDDETVFNSRSAAFTFNVVAITEDAEGFAEERQWARDFWAALEPHHTSVYVNFLMDEGEDRIREAYGDAKFTRLQALKQKYDPDNVLHLNQNIPPG